MRLVVTLYKVFSTVGDVQYCVGYRDRCRGYLEHRGVFSTVGGYYEYRVVYLEYGGGIS